ncbi:MAG: tryptophan synthase subunit alpha [Bacteroidales bacterium]
MNPLQALLSDKKQKLLSLFFTAGHPEAESAANIIGAAESAGIDFLEVGMPYSDPLADGPVIQQSSTWAISNGMTIALLLKQLHDIKSKTGIPLLLMGYLNPVMQYGTERFIREASEAGISALILPDLPIKEYLSDFQPLYRKYHISPVFLVTPRTSAARIRTIDQVSDAFIYVVSSAATTGTQKNYGQEQTAYFRRLNSMGLKNPLICGFGIHNNQTLMQAWDNLSGAICGSAFIKKLDAHPDAEKAIKALLRDLGL